MWHWMSCLLLVSATQAFAQASSSVAAVHTTIEQAPPLDAHQVVNQVTGQIIDVINGNKQLLADKPDDYFSKVGEVLDPVVAFSYIAKVVMSKHYKAASAEQRSDFAEAFRDSMVETFAKGMANYSDFEITVREPESDISGKRKVEVLQDVKGGDGNHLLSYTMAKTKDGEWKLINVVLNGVNLGKSFRDQFIQAMRQNKNDYDKVTATWGKQDA